MLSLMGPFLTDFYKWGHCGMIPPETRVIYSNVTARGAKYFSGEDTFDNKVLIVGIRRAIDDVMALWDLFFRMDKAEALGQLRKELVLALPSNAKIDSCLQHFADLWDIGHLPVKIMVVPEGTRLPIRVPFMTIRNTDERFAFITNFLETLISAEVWKTIVNASTAFEFLEQLTVAAQRTVDPDFETAYNLVQYQAHDFSLRGMSGIHDGMNSGIGHLACFRGTDTLASIPVIRHHYHTEENEHIGGSVVATEHMVMCLGGAEDEFETFRRLIQDDYPTGIISIVSDTWDFFKVLTDYIPRLKDVILARKPDSSGRATVVLRPDSGTPEYILCGDPDAPEGSPEYKGAVQILWEIFGGTQTPQGKNLLDDHISLIYGDSITRVRSEVINGMLINKGFASLNSLRGIGSYTYQYVTRDTFSIAVKATAAIVGDETRNLLKNPKTDDGTKKSATGFLRVEKVPTPALGGDSFTYKLIEGLTLEEAEASPETNLLEPVYDSGVFAPMPVWQDIRNRVKDGLKARIAARG